MGSETIVVDRNNNSNNNINAQQPPRFPSLPAAGNWQATVVSSLPIRTNCGSTSEHLLAFQMLARCRMVCCEASKRTIRGARSTHLAGKLTEGQVGGWRHRDRNTLRARSTNGIAHLLD